MRFAIIGAGYISPINTRALMACNEVEIVAISNRTVSKAEAVRDTLGLSCPIYNDWKQMLDAECPDVAVICIYNDLHRECFLDCCARGIHVLVEKPMANTYSECLEMIAAAEKTGIKVSVLHTQRYGSTLQTAKAYISAHAEELGQLVSVNDRMSCHYFWEGRNPWHLDPVRSGGGIVMNYGVHQLDRIHWLMGGKTTQFHTHYVAAKPGIDTISSYTMMGVTDAGVGYTVTCNGYSGPFVNEIDLVFLNGIVRCVLIDNGQSAPGVFIGSTEKPFTRIPDICDNGPDNHLMYVREMKDAVAYLNGQHSVAPITMEWAAEMVYLCNTGL